MIKLNESALPTRSLRPHYTISQEVVQLSAQCPTRFAEVSVPQEIQAHDHEFYELCFVLAGTSFHRTESGVTELRRGDVVVLPVGAVHAFERPSGLRVINGYYLGEWLLGDRLSLGEPEGVIECFLAAHLFRAPSFRQPLALRLKPADFERCLVEVEDLLAETAAPAPSLLFLRSALCKLFVRLRRLQVTSGGPGAFAALRPEVRRTIDEIENHILAGDPFSVAAAGRLVGVSTHHLSRVFKQEVGWSPLEYFQRRRVQFACSLLLDPARTIVEVAHQLGFSDGPHFSRAFKAITQRTPRDYRRLFISGNA